MFGIFKTAYVSIKFIILCGIVEILNYVSIPETSKLIFGLLFASLLLNAQINWIANYQMKAIKSVFK